MEKLEKGKEAAAPATTTNTAGTPLAGDTITIKVKFRGRTISVSLSPESTSWELKSQLEPLTNILPCNQKLIFKGKVLEDSMSLKSLHISDGSKIMLIASQGMLQKGDVTSAHQSQPHNPITREQLERWKSTGTVVLSEEYFKAIPDEVWDCGPLKVLYISNTSIRELPAKIGTLKSLNKLYVYANDLSDEMVSWDGVSQLESLKILSLSQNKLTVLPSALGNLISLTEIHISMNKLTCLPDELGRLNQLRILRVNDNRIRSVPESVGNCTSIIEIDLSDNLLEELPESLSNLRNLQILYLRDNSLESLPSDLFKNCTQLFRLELHGTKITKDYLRQLDGWADFDERLRIAFGRRSRKPFRRADNRQ